MNAVFLGGSRRISRLNDQIRAKLEEITERQFQILIGDANGADRAIQAQLAEWQYPNVTVYFVGARPRNNVGAWPVQRVSTPRGLRGFELYSAKDKRMADDANYGLMLWDGLSRGTLANVMNLANSAKPVAVYNSKLRRFLNVHTRADVETLRSGADNCDVSAEQTELPLDTRRKSTKRRKRRTA